jgi:long-chain acyl-CoA synthetase
MKERDMSPLQLPKLEKLLTASLFEWRVSQSGSDRAACWCEDGAWKTVTWQEYAALVKGLALRLRQMGVVRGDRVAVYAETCFEWALVDLAVQSFGGIIVAIHPSYSVDEVLHALAVSNPKILFCGGERPAQTIPDVLARHGTLAVYRFEGRLSLRSVRSFKDLLASAAGASDQMVPRTERSSPVEETDVATIVFTSGTAGMPKGVCLTQKNLVATALASFKHLGLALDRPRSLHWLPFAHLFGRIGIYLDLIAGSSATYSRGVRHLPEDLRVACPHFLFAVPKVLSRCQAAIHENIGRRPTWQRKLFDAAVKLVLETAAAREEAAERAGRRWNALHAVIKASIFRPVIDSFGSNLLLIVVGSAPVERKLCLLFEAFGIAVSEGYGMTESSGVAFVNPYSARRLGTVGTAIETVQWRIGSDRELLMKGESIFQGYLNADDTRAAFTEDGWFRTGDLVDLATDGYLRVIGRKKEILITDGGENITPERIEARLASYPLIKDAVVFGDNKPYLVAVINADAACGADAAGREGWRSSRLFESVQRIVDEVNVGLAKFETIRKFVLAKDDFSIDNGELTPTLKKRRTIIGEHYRADIEALYAAELIADRS